MGKLRKAEIEVSECMVCHGKRLGGEAFNKVFNADGCYVLMTGVPSTVCQDCGERPYSRVATERARLLAHDPPAHAPAKSAPTQVYEFA